MNKNAKIYVAGHRGLVGSAITRKLRNEGYTNLVLRNRNELDLTNQLDVEKFFTETQPEYVFVAAAKVGGIHANNTYPAQFIYQNLQIQNNLIHFSHLYGVKKLLFLGSSCVYPKFPKIPITEDQLLSGKLEPTNESYAIAKIAGIKMIEAYNKEYGTDFISLMPTNLYGPNDNYHPENSHVLAALIRKFVDARQDGLKEVEIWGTGKPKREFLHVDDFASACVYLMNNYTGSEIINVGSGEEITILDLAKMISEEVGFTGKLVHDLSKPDGTPRKVMDISKLKEMGWKPEINLRDGIRNTIEDYKLNNTN